MAATCNTCDATFTRKGNLRRHQKDRCRGGLFKRMKEGEVHPKMTDIAVLNNGSVKKRKMIPSPNSDSDDSNAEDDNASNLPSPNQIKFLPSTVDGLTKRFNELFPKYCRNKDLNARNELVSLLDALLEQNGINRTMYTKMNDLLSASIGYGINDADEKG